MYPLYFQIATVKTPKCGCLRRDVSLTPDDEDDDASDDSSYVSNQGGRSNTPGIAIEAFCEDDDVGTVYDEGNDDDNEPLCEDNDSNVQDQIKLLQPTRILRLVLQPEGCYA